jgi:predicted extracellular nuclease
VAAVAASGLLAAPASANTAGTGLVISEAYGGGGNSGATYTNDFIELYNPTSAPVDVGGWSVQYRSKSNGGNGVTPLTGTVPAHGYYLVQEAKGSGGTTPLPAPDATGSLAMSGSDGTVFLADTTDVVTLSPGSVVGAAHVVDLVGYGATSTYEGAAAAATANATSVGRDAAGTDTDVNAGDFTVAAPTPGGGPATQPACPAEMTIEAIQGVGASSPCDGVDHDITTRGIVTAAFPVGGFYGFYVQTPGTGGDLDFADHRASDGLYVYSPATVATVAIGDYLEVTGEVSEYGGMTELTIPDGGAVTPLDGTGVAPVKPATVGLPATETRRETLEGMLVAPQGPFTVADNYSLNQYGEIGLASGTSPLSQPTDVADPHDAAAIRAVEDANAARSVRLDDGSSWNYLTQDQAKGTPLPWLTQDHQIRVGAPVTFTAPVVFDHRNGAWNYQPTSQLTGAGDSPALFGHTRTAAPEPTGGNVHIASFNVLNYFPTTGADFEAAGGSCSYYDDRDGNPVTVRTCTGPNGEDGPRGAADEASFLRQQAKIVHAVNGLGADVVSLEEIENSALFGEDRDAAVATLVDALNADAGGPVWAYVPTPPTAGDQADEDVIRTAFIYQRRVVHPVGDSEIDDVAAFDNARDPLAQAFRPIGGGSPSDFVVIVNHFKSKGSGPDDGSGLGNSNPAALATVTGAHVWNINSVESVALEYSRFNYNATNFYTDAPWRASDHDPLLVGIDSGHGRG